MPSYEKAKTPVNTYKQFILFPEMWGGVEYEEIKVRAKRKRAAKKKAKKV